MGLVAVEHHCNQGHVIFFGAGDQGVARQGGVACLACECAGIVYGFFFI